MRLKSHALCCAFAWSPAKLGSPPMLAAASYYGAMDDNFSSDPVLDIRVVDVRDTDETDMPLAGSVHLPARACRVDWAAHAMVPHGIVAVACEDGGVYVFSVTALLEGAERALLCTIRAHRGCVRGCQLNASKPDVLATGGDDGEWFVWNLKPAATTTTTTSDGAAVLQLEATKVCVIDSHSGSSKASSLAHGAGEQRSGSHHGSAHAAAAALSLPSSAAIVDLQWHPRRAYILATATATNYVHVWNLRTTSLAVSLNLNKSARGGVVSCLAWHPTEATQLAVGLDGGTRAVVQLWELKCAMTPKAELMDTATVGGDGTSNNNNNNSSGNNGHDLDALLDDVGGHSGNYNNGTGNSNSSSTGGISALSWNAHETAQLVAGYADGRTVVFDVQRQTRVAALRGQTSPVVAVQWCPAIAHVLATSSFAPLLCVSTADDDGGSASVASTATTTTTSTPAAAAAAGGAARAGTAAAAAAAARAMMTGATATTAATATTTTAAGADVPSWLRRPCGASVNFALLVASHAPVTTAHDDVDADATTTPPPPPPGALQLTQLSAPPLSPHTRHDVQLQHELAALPAGSAERAAWLETHHYALLAAVASARSSRKPILHYLSEQTAASASPEQSNNNHNNSSSSGGGGASASVHDGNDDKDDVFDALSRQQQRSYEERAAAEVAQGRLDDAVDVCLAEERYDDAFAIAYLRGGELLARVHAQYTRFVHAQPQRERRHVLLAGAIASGDYVALIHADVPWREVLSLVLAFVGDGFVDVCNRLGDALRERGEGDGAYTCYVCARNVDAVLSLWQAQGRSSRQVVRDALLLEHVTERAAGGAFFATCLQRYGVKLLLDGHTAEALTYLQRAAQLGEATAQVLVDRARALLPVGKPDNNNNNNNSENGSAMTRDFPFAYEPVADTPSATGEALLHALQQRRLQQEAAAAAAAQQQQQQLQQQQMMMYAQQQQQQQQQMMYAQQQQQQMRPPASASPPAVSAAAAPLPMYARPGMPLPSTQLRAPTPAAAATPPLLPPPASGGMPPGTQQPAAPPPPPQATAAAGYASNNNSSSVHALSAQRRNIPLVAMPAAAATTSLAGRAYAPPPPPPHGALASSSSAAAAYHDPMSYNYYAPSNNNSVSNNSVSNNSSMMMPTSSRPPAPGMPPPAAAAATAGSQPPLPPPPPPPPPSSAMPSALHGMTTAAATAAARSSALPSRAASVGSNAHVASVTGNGAPPPPQPQPQQPPQPRLMPHPVSAYSSLRPAAAAAPPPPPPPSSSAMPNGVMAPASSYNNSSSSNSSMTATAGAAYMTGPPPPPPQTQTQMPLPPRASSMPSALPPSATRSGTATPATAAAAPPPPPPQAGMQGYYAQGGNSSGMAAQQPAPPPPSLAMQAPQPPLPPPPSSSLAASAGNVNSIADADVQALRSPTAQHIVQRLQQLVPHIAHTQQRHAVDQAAVRLYQLLLQNAITDDVQQLLLQYVSAAGTPAAKSTWLLISQRSAAAVRSFVNLRYL